ncbi:PucR family transcriptional regulator ligand-binding domain-containing protein [Paenibacillus sp. KS-LC4]|uniref:PucR family transcriptional regulator n=1 Tax=Paenibacillus sp. KS-LC4 TaxID=2979727 RepID=UPI0030D57D2E
MDAIVQTLLQLTIRDILQRPPFQKAEVLASEEALNRTVRWVHIMEVIQAGQLLSGGELILTTGIGWQEDEERSLIFLQQLLHSGASGLCIELVTYTARPPKRMLELAKNEHFPILLFHEQVRYIDITQDLHTHFITQHHKTVSELEALSTQLGQLRTQYFEEKRRYQDDLWLADWLAGKHDLTEISYYIRYIKPSAKLGSGAVCVFQLEAAQMETKDFAVLMLQRNRLARVIFEREGFLLLTLLLQGQLVFILLDQLEQLKWKERLLQAVEQLRHTDMKHEPAIFSGLWGIGKSMMCPDQAAESYATAKETIAIQLDAGPLPAPFFDELHTYKIISALKKSGMLEELIRDYIEPLASYDKEKHGQLLLTLKTYFIHSGSKQDTARELFIARQTLYHRLDKIIALLGEDFMHADKRLAIELAVNAYEYTRGVIR